MIEAVVDSLIESVTTLLLGKMISIAYKRGVQDKPKGLVGQAGKREDVWLILGGDLGESLILAYEGFAKTRNSRIIEEYIKKAVVDKEITFVVELSRRAEEDVRIQFGKPVEYVVSSVREIDPGEFPEIAARIAGFLKTINTVHKGPKIHLILSMPVVLGLQIGQFVGLSHYDIELYHFEKGRYLKVPCVKRT
ncbi:MAG: hypothetical protein HYW01_06615 [Deltaproteobacteria bacterium]|nr:hypothetical protein [Deltaproteobacteria bacterium]